MQDAGYATSDLIVALEHVDTVSTALQELSVPFGVKERSALLGLALLDLGDVAAAADALEGAQPSSAASGQPPLDRVLAGLRASCARAHAGWSPTMGKNRLLGNVVGGGKISHGGGTVPTASAQRPGRRTGDSGYGVRVGLLDTSIWPHPALSGGWVAPAGDVLDGDRTGGAAPGQEGPRFVAGHATFIAGLILDSAPGCVVEHRGVLSDETGEADSWAVANAIVRLGDTGVDLLNLSLVCYTDDAQPPLVLATAIDRLDPRIVVVAAAGNHGDLAEGEAGHRRQPAWPAALDDVLAVGSIDDNGNEAPFTPANAPWVDVLAPGVDVSSAFFDGPVRLPDGTVKDFDGSATWSGTSFSAALVSGAIAARTVPGEVSARAALARLAESFERVDGARPRWRPDGAVSA